MIVNVLKASLQYVLKMSWRRLEEVFKTSWRRLEDVLKTFWRRLEDVLARRLEGVLKMSRKRFCKKSWRRLEDVLPRRIYWSWSRRLEDVFWKPMTKVNIFVFIKTSSEDEDERRLQDVFIKTNVCWVCSTFHHLCKRRSNRHNCYLNLMLKGNVSILLNHQHFSTISDGTTRYR